MAKRITSLPCTVENCGELFPKCGTATTYGNHKCRCDPCAEAGAEKARKQYLAHKDRILERNREYHKANSERLCANSRAYQAANREAVRVRKRERYLEVKDSHLAKCRQWRKANPDYNRDHYAADREHHRERSRRWREANPDHRRELGRAARARVRNATVVKFTPEQWAQKKAYWGNRCYLQLPGHCTGGADTMDHVKPLAADGQGMHMLANLRPACRPCNSSKNATWPYAVPAGPR